MNSNLPAQTRSTQRLYPLFLLGFGLIALGSYLGHQSYFKPNLAPRPDVIAAPSMLEVSEAELVVDGIDGGLDLRYLPDASHQLELTMRQQNSYVSPTTGERSLETRLSMLVRETSLSAEDVDELSIERAFSNVRVDVLEDGRRIGADITRQLEMLLKGAEQRIAMSERGQIERFEWLSDTNAQVRQTLNLVDDAARLLTTHFRREPVHVGEEWTYRVRSEAHQPSEGFEADGNLVVTNRLVGVVERAGREYAVIRQRFEGKLTGAFGEAGKTTTYRMRSEGSGMVLFDIERGAIYSSQVELERTTEFEALDGLEIPQTSRVELHLVRRDLAHL